MVRRLRPRRRLFTVSPKSPSRLTQTKGPTRSRVLTDTSGFAAAEFNFPNYTPALIITEPKEDTSSWQ